MAIPSSAEESIEAPTPLMTNAAEGIFINVKRYSSSDFDISPLSNNFTAVSAPVGYPQRNPRERAQEPAVPIPKMKLSGFPKSEPRSLEAPLTIISDEIIIKGKTAGITVFMQSEMPFFICSADIGEDRTVKAIIHIHKTGRVLALRAFVCILVSSPS